MANVRPDDFCACGKRFGDRDMHRGTIGREYAWQWVTDDQLRTELARRNIDGVVTLAEIIRAASNGEVRAEFNRRGMCLSLSDYDDAALRAECERRKIPIWGTKSVEQAADERSALARALNERDHLANLVDDVTAQRDKLDDEVHVLRAQACHCGCNRLREGPGHVAGSALTLYEAALAEMTRRALTAETKYRSLPSTATLLAESGPGLRSMTHDNAIAHLPEDLLADDAD